jgi:G3E family GTPase
MAAGKENRAPVIILTGFLGAGKTTLLNRILTTEHGRRVAVIVNEFGAVGIDHHLLFASEQEIVQMSNGCICCTVHGDLLRGLFQLLEQRSKFDSLVIETTGLADPAPVVQTLLFDERIRSQFSLHAIVTLIDSRHIGLHLDDSKEAQEQITFADLILLNKTDLVTPEELDAVEAKVKTWNQSAAIVRTKNSEMDVASLLDGSTFDWSKRIKAEPALFSDDHDHQPAVATVSLVEPGELDGLKVSHWFRSLLAEMGPEILRMKGILNLRGDPDQFVFQGVHSLFEGRPGRAWESGEERTNRLVFIGKKLDSAKITETFKGCFASENGDARDRVDPFGRNPLDTSSFTLDQIRYWTRQNLVFPADTPIVVKEVPCVKPGCPPIETAILAFLKGEPPRFYKIQKTINEVTFDDVYNLIENPLPCC